MFSKIVVLYEIYSKKLEWPNTFGMSLVTTGRNIFSFQRTFFFIKYSRNRAVHDTKQRLNHLNLNTSIKKMAKNIVIVRDRGTQHYQ